ncbi:peptidoglycan recognition family protein [Clostridium sp. C8-1-8]|uniref:peptidoglycan recognition protein family protein n=1 Tax=Clostridium sp. C8-1-8 TaxID=2698831 RepID=UPI00136E314A|nr:peptidoglycan recognition family protein [Clostridium sp. C8-1-8]
MNIIQNNFAWNGTFTDGENKPNKIVWHNADASSCTVEDIHSWHLANGWAGIGYHLFIRKDGSVYQGRQFGWRGSHCPTANYNSIGVCCEGKYMSEQMPATQLQACLEVKAYLQGLYGNMPSYGHRELWQTDCPGINFPLDNIKNGQAQVNTVTQNNNVEGDYMAKVWRNGNSEERVYNDYNLTNQIGIIDPHEEAEAIADLGNRMVVIYNGVDANKRACKKTGFVVWRGGL